MKTLGKISALATAAVLATGVLGSSVGASAAADWEMTWAIAGPTCPAPNDYIRQDQLKAVVSPDGRYVYVGLGWVNCSPSAIYAVDTGTNQIVRTLSKDVFYSEPVLRIGEVRGMALSPDGATLYALIENQIRVIDAMTLTIRASHPLPGIGDNWQDGLDGLGLSPDGNTLIVGGHEAISLGSVTETRGVIWVLDSRSMAIRKTVQGFSKYDRPYDFDFTKEGDRVFVSMGGGSKVIAMSTSTFTLDGTASMSRFAISAVLTPDEQYLIVTNPYNFPDGKYPQMSPVDKVAVIRTSDMTVLKTESAFGTPWDIASTQDGRYAVVTLRGLNAFTVFDTRTFQKFLTVQPIDYRGTQAIAMSPTQNVMYVTNTANLMLWSVPAPQLPPGAVTSLKATALKGAIRVSWSAPRDPGSGGQVSYEYRVGTTSWKSTTAASVTIKGRKGARITVQVRATNSAGHGPELSVSGVPK